MPELMTLAETAEFFRVSKSTVQRMAKAGRLPFAQKLPGQTGAYLFDLQEMEIVDRDGRPR